MLGTTTTERPLPERYASLTNNLDLVYGTMPSLYKNDVGGAQNSVEKLFNAVPRQNDVETALKTMNGYKSKGDSYEQLYQDIVSAVDRCSDTSGSLLLVVIGHWYGPTYQ